jgi:hypothetical protein
MPGFEGSDDVGRDTQRGVDMAVLGFKEGWWPYGFSIRSRADLQVTQ